MSVFPTTGVLLGRAVELGFTNDKAFKWRSGALLITNAAGDRLWIIIGTKLKRSTKAINDYAKRYSITESEVKKAGQRYTKWSEFEPEQLSVARVSGRKLKIIGKAQYIVYESDKWEDKKHKYCHTFKVPPMVRADNKTNPGLIAISGGKLRVQPRGIIG